MVDKELLKYLESFLTPQRIARFAEVLEKRTEYITVAIEDVFQLHNTSAIIRSCDVFGIQSIHLVEGRFGNKLDKNIALGAQQWVDSYRYKDSKSCMEHLRKKGYQIVATTPAPGAIGLDEFKIGQKIALFFGTEKEGLSEEILENADVALRIPMVGFSESLNVSVSAAIILQQLSSQLRQSDHPWKLSEEEIREKRFKWASATIKDSERIIERYLSARS